MRNEAWAASIFFAEGHSMDGAARKNGEQGASDYLQGRTKAFALRVIRLVDRLPNTRSANGIGRQLLDSAMSVGANYRSACRGRSRAEFCAKMGIVEEEADETVYWLELLAESGVVKPRLLTELLREADEIVRMVVASIRTARRSDRGKAEATSTNRERRA